MEIFDYKYISDGDLIVGYSNTTHYTPTDTDFLFSTLRLIYIKRGMVDWRIGNDIYTLKAGDIALFDNIKPRKIIKIYPNEPLNYDLFGFSPGFLFVPVISKLYYGNHHKMINAENESTNTLHVLLNELKNEMMSENKYKQEAIRNLLSVILIQVARSINLSETDGLENKNIQVIATATQYIQNHFSEKLNLSILAAMCGYSKEHFSRSFKKHIGTSVSSYITNVRIENTLNLLNNENCNVLSAALQSGFNTSSGFYKAFKKHKNTSPRISIAGTV